MPQCMHEARYDTPLYVPTRTEPPHCHARARTRELGLGGWSYTGTRPPAGTLHDPTTCMAELRTYHDRDRRQKAVAPKQAPLLHAWHGRRAGGRSEKRARAHAVSLSPGRKSRSAGLVDDASCRPLARQVPRIRTLRDMRLVMEALGSWQQHWHAARTAPCVQVRPRPTMHRRY
jgi:hypothetical protein